MKKILILSLFLIGCDKSSDTGVIKVECIGTKALGDVCKYTTHNGFTTCIARPNTKYATSVECNFYNNIIKGDI